MRILLTTIAGLSLWGGLVYRVYKLDSTGIAGSLALALITALTIAYLGRKINERERFVKPYRVLQTADGWFGKPYRVLQTADGWFGKPYRVCQTFVVVAYLILSGFCFYILYHSRTLESLISPWQTVPWHFFAIYAAASGLLLFLALRIRTFWPLASLHALLSFSVLNLVFPLGYGFDPHIHEATMNLIRETGMVLPKPNMYLGQYGLIVILNWLFKVPIAWLNLWLVPVLASIFIPWSIIKTLDNWFDDYKSKNLVIAALFLIPNSLFLITTPQHLAWTFALLAVLQAVRVNNWHGLSIAWLLAGASALTHPIAGLPALAYLLAVTLYHSELGRRAKVLAIASAVIATALALPALLLVANKGQAIAGPEGPGLSVSAPAIPFLPNSEAWYLNLLYFTQANRAWLFYGLLAVGLYLAWKHRGHCLMIFLNIAFSGALIMSFWLARRLDLDFLIVYEQAEFLDRLLASAAIFLVPVLLIALYPAVQRIMALERISRAIWLAGLAGFLTASLYLAYPRFDNYFNSRSYAMGQADLEATAWINNEAKGDYIVLSNQQVAAAALKQFGFKKYYKDDIFYYPIPTSGPLYSFYLDMVYVEPSRETMERAMDMAGVDTGYFVLNKYWWAFDKIAAEAKLAADSWTEIAGGKVLVFKYGR